MSGRSDAAAVVRGMLVGRPRLRRSLQGAWRRLKRMVEGPERTQIQLWLDEVGSNLSPNERRMLVQRFDASTPLPDRAEADLAPDHPRLVELRDAYRRVDLPVTVPSVWEEQLLDHQLDMQYFRGESPFVWNYREWPRAMTLKYFIFLEYVRERDSAGLLDRLGEDGAFGCWTFEYPGYPRVSRDLLDSVNEILFLERQLGILSRDDLRVLDIGAGYGRTAHRMIHAANVRDYCCVDVVPESTFLCEYYLQNRGCLPPARVVPLPDLTREVVAGGFDLAINIHSFSECTYAAVSWWLEWIEALHIPNLLIVPNDRDELLAFERDGARRDFRPLVEAAGYELAASEPVFDDPAVQELLRVPDHFLLFRRTLP